MTDTSTNKQRHTCWMTSKSLFYFLDPEDHRKTIEEDLTPFRAILTVYKP
ncbi:DUF1698 domain-containing protein [Candidatus Williamhamiltonella defendens]|nr:DUF1698 domain-containing protein [Candidatus Hamiltonella defensa]